MKSAYEKAMERLNKEAPRRSLSDDEKAELAEIDNQADARVSETRLAYDAKLAGLNPMEAHSLQEELQQEVARIEAKRESDKDAIWNRG